ncbi:WD domain, G-beta repeat-containing protein [Babesia caballi]|uniref:WD domain, G-beta repeat-containing protein n=1 Tax=Babesia caballi TaxID=5871 RepID=A0AAV4LPV2_BABCB|nr:WD domain, G-beta repeat-containing protein [Babesia caballi]
MWKDERVIAVGDNAVVLLDSTGRVEREISKEGFRCTTNSVAAATDLVCVATSDKAKIAFISESQSYRVSVPELITAVAFSRCGDILYAGSNTGRLYVWQIRTGTLIKNKQVFFNTITDAKVDFANTTLLLASQNGDLALFKLVELFLDDNKGTLYLGHSTSVTGIANLMQGPFEHATSFVSVARDKNIRFWHHTKRTALQSHFLQHPPLGLVASRTGARLFVPCEMGHIAVVPLGNFQDTFLLSGHVGSVTGCAETLNLVTCALDGVRVWDVEARICISHYGNIGNGDHHYPDVPAGPRINKLLSGVRLAEKAQFVPLKNVVSQDSLATIALN